MKVSHTELEELRRDFAGWVARKRFPTGFPRAGYNQAVRLSIYRFLKTGDPSDAVEHLTRLLDRFGLKNGARRDMAQAQLSHYLDAHLHASPIVIEPKFNIRLDLGGEASVGGEIGRIDLDSQTGKYCGILIGDFPPDWSEQLRFPIIQKAISDRLKRPENEVLVGTQGLGGDDYASVCFDSSAIADAIDEARSLIIRAATELGR